MRLWFVLISLTAILFASTGCQSFQQRFKQSNSSLFGLKKNKGKSASKDEFMDPLGARDTNRLLWDDLAPGQIGTTLKTRVLGGKDETAANSHFAEGKRLYSEGTALMEQNPSGGLHQKTFLDAANQFRLAAASWPDSDLEEEASFFEGESYFFADHYVQSNRAFEKLIASYAGTRFLDMAEQRRFSIALYWLELAEQYKGPKLADAKRPKSNPAAEAKRVLHRIRIDDPTGKLADDATLALGKAFLNDQRYYEAADAFEDLRRNYPGSKHQFTAHMLELQAHLQGYQGKSYDDTPLKKADELLKSIVRQFPDQAREQLPYLEEQAGRIRNQLAERDYSLGQYFEKRGENRAAKLYYEQVAQNFEGTQFADSIGDKIAEVAAKPPVPEQHAKWLVDLFPNEENDKPIIAAGENGTLFR